MSTNQSLKNKPLSINIVAVRKDNTTADVDLSPEEFVQYMNEFKLDDTKELKLLSITFLHLDYQSTLTSDLPSEETILQ